MAEPLNWRTAFKNQPGAPQPTTPASPVVGPKLPLPPPPAPTRGGELNWKTAFKSQPAPAPSRTPQAPSSPSAGTSGLPAPIPQGVPTLRLSDGLVIPAVMTTAPKDVSAETMLALPTGVSGTGAGAEQGAAGIDLGATAKAVGLARAMKDIRTRKAAGELFTPGEEKVLEAREYMKARGEVDKWYKSTTAGDENAPPLLDISPAQAGINYWLEGANSYNSVLDAIPLELREVVGPFLGMAQGTGLTATTPTGVKEYNEGLGWGGLDWGGRLSLFTMLSNYVGSEGDMDWGGTGHMKSVARGEDLFSQWDQLEALSEREDISYPRQGAGWLLRGLSNVVAMPVRTMDQALTAYGIVDEDTITEDGAEKFGDFAAAMGLTLIDPDIWGGVGGSVSKFVTKAGDGLSSLRNLAKSQVMEDASQVITQMVNTLKHEGAPRAPKGVEEALALRGKSPGPGPTDAAGIIDGVMRDVEKAAGPGARYILESFTASILGQEGSASEATVKAMEAMRQSVGSRGKLMEGVKLNREAAREAAAEVASWLGAKPSEAGIKQALAQTSKILDQLTTQGQQATKNLKQARKNQAAARAAGDVLADQAHAEAAATASRWLSNVTEATHHVQKKHDATLLKRNILKEARTSGGRLEVPPRLKAIVNYRDAAMKHLGAVALHADMRAMHKTLQLLTKGRKVNIAPAVLADLQAKLRKAVVAVAKAEGPVDHWEAMKHLQTLQVQAARQGGPAIADAMGQGVRHLEKAENLARANLKTLTDMGEKAGHFKSKALGAEKHVAAVDALRKAADESVGSRALMGLSVSLQRMAKLYKHAAQVGVKNMPEVDQALIRQLGRADLVHLDASPNRVRATLLKGVEGLKRFADPMRASAATTYPEVQQILKGGMNVIATGIKELANLAKGATEAGQRAVRFIHYLDSAQGSTILQSTSDVTLWKEALNTLRRLANSPGEEGSSAIIDSLARMWTPKGEHSAGTMKKLGDAARKFLLDKPDASFELFQKHMLVKTAQTVLGKATGPEGMLGRRMDELTGDADRSVALATQAILHAVALDRVTNDLALFAADLPPAAIDAMVALSSQDPRRAGEYVEEALVLLDRMGMPPKLQKATTSWGNDLKAGFEVLTDPKNDQRFFIPRRWIDTMAGRLGGLVKSGDTYAELNPNPLEAKIGKTWGAALIFWNKSLLTGNLMPLPRYFVAMLAGNISQVYTRLGAAEAGAFAARSAYDLADGAVSHIPFFGETIRAKTIGRFENGLPSAMGTFISPTVSKFFDPARHKSAEMLHPAGGGKAISFGELRKAALKYGVMTSFIGQSGMQDAAARVLRDSKFDKGMAWMGQWTDSWADMAEHIEQRQRVGEFINLVVNKGMDPQKAGALVRDMLYDWNHPMSQVEMDYFKRVFMFYTFQRKAMGQALRHLFNPTMGLHNTMSRNVRTARIHKGSQTMTDQYTDAHYPPDPYNYPWWVKENGQRVYMGKRPLTPAQRQYYTQRGKDVTHVMNSVPAPTTFESFNQLRTLVAATGKMAHGDFEGAASSSLDVLSSMTGRVGEAAVDGVKQSAGMEGPRYGGKKIEGKYYRPVTTPMERELLVPLLEMMAPGTVDRDGSEVFVSSATYMAWRTLLPTFSVELASWLDPLMGSEQADNKAMYLTRQLSGIMKETPYKAKADKADK